MRLWNAYSSYRNLWYLDSSNCVNLRNKHVWVGNIVYLLIAAEGTSDVYHAEHQVHSK